MNIKTYRVRGTDLDHDGQRYPEGSEIELEEKAARKIDRWLEPVAPVESPKSTKAAKADDKKSIEGNGQNTGQGEGDKE